MSNIGVYSLFVEVGVGQTEVVYDAPQADPFFDLNIHVVPKRNFTGQIRFYIGDDLAKTVTYNNENGSCIFAPTNPDFPEIFPPTQDRPSALHRELKVSGASLRAKVEIQNSGSIPCKFEIFFMRKYR